MKYIIENITNPWIILFLVLIVLTVFSVVWFFITLLKSRRIEFESWRQDLKKDLNAITVYEVFEHMKDTVVKESVEESNISITIEKLTKRFLVFIMMFFLAVLILLPFGIKKLPDFNLPGIANPSFLFYEFYAIILITLTISFFICFYIFHGVKKPENDELYLYGKGGEYLNKIRNDLFNLACETRIQMIFNEKRKKMYLRSKFFGWMGILFSITLFVLFIFSK